MAFKKKLEYEGSRRLPNSRPRLLPALPGGKSSSRGQDQNYHMAPPKFRYSLRKEARGRRLSAAFGGWLTPVLGPALAEAQARLRGTNRWNVVLATRQAARERGCLIRLVPKDFDGTEAAGQVLN